METDAKAYAGAVNDDGVDDNHAEDHAEGTLLDEEHVEPRVENERLSRHHERPSHAGQHHDEQLIDAWHAYTHDLLGRADQDAQVGEEDGPEVESPVSPM